MTANWLSGTRWQYPKGYGDVEPMNAQAATVAKDDSESRKTRESIEPRATGMRQ